MYLKHLDIVAHSLSNVRGPGYRPAQRQSVLCKERNRRTAHLNAHTKTHTNSKTPAISCQNNTPPCHQGINRSQGHVKSWTVKIISMHLGYNRVFLNTLRPMDGRKKGRKGRNEKNIEISERSEKNMREVCFF